MGSYNKGKLNSSYKHGFAHRGRATMERIFYSRWQTMKTRCLNKNRKDWKNYGGRGVNFCPEWLDFNNFKNDMFDGYVIHFLKHGAKDTTLDRVSVEEGYSKQNCRWATKAEQGGNRRNSFQYEYKNKSYTIKELQSLLGWPYATIYARIKKGIPLDKPNGYRLTKNQV